MNSKKERKDLFNILRGMVMASFLKSYEKRVLCAFITELERREDK